MTNLLEVKSNDQDGGECCSFWFISEGEMTEIPNIWSYIPIIFGLVICWIRSKNFCLKSNRGTQKDEARHSKRGRVCVINISVMKYWRQHQTLALLFSPMPMSVCCAHTHTHTHTHNTPYTSFHILTTVSIHKHIHSLPQTYPAVGLRYRALNFLCAHGQHMWCFILRISVNLIVLLAIAVRMHYQSLWL